jgi:hypothetical protein
VTLTFKQKRQRRLPILRLLALAIVALLLLLGSNAFAKKPLIPEGDTKIISQNRPFIKTKGFGSWEFRSSTICVDGYKFLIVATDETDPFVQTTQFYEERNGKALPAKCK